MLEMIDEWVTSQQVLREISTLKFLVERSKRPLRRVTPSLENTTPSFRRAQETPLLTAGDVDRRPRSPIAGTHQISSVKIQPSMRRPQPLS